MHTPGPGDEATWGACVGHPNDPRTEEPDNERDALALMDGDELLDYAYDLLDAQESILGALKAMTRTFIDGSHYETGNPYLRPEVKAALIAIAKAEGSSAFGNDWMYALNKRPRT